MLSKINKVPTLMELRFFLVILHDQYYSSGTIQTPNKTCQQGSLRQNKWERNKENGERRESSAILRCSPINCPHNFPFIDTNTLEGRVMKEVLYNECKKPSVGITKVTWHIQVHLTSCNGMSSWKIAGTLRLFKLNYPPRRAFCSRKPMVNPFICGVVII